MISGFIFCQLHAVRRGRACTDLADPAPDLVPDSSSNAGTDIRTSNPGPGRNPGCPKLHPALTFTLQTLLHITSLIPVGEIPIIPARFLCFCELLPLDFGGRGKRGTTGPVTGSVVPASPRGPPGLPGGALRWRYPRDPGPCGRGGLRQGRTNPEFFSCTRSGKNPAQPE